MIIEENPTILNNRAVPTLLRHGIVKLNATFSIHSCLLGAKCVWRIVTNSESKIVRYHTQKVCVKKG